MMNLASIGNLVIKAGKVGVVFLGTLAVGELGYIGMTAVESDVELGVNVAKELAKPTPIAVKPKRFGKTEVVTIHPLTGETKKYTGTEPAKNAKNPVKLYK